MTLQESKSALGDIILECKAFAQPLGSENAWTTLGDGKFELHGHHIRVICEDPPLPEADDLSAMVNEGGEDEQEGEGDDIVMTQQDDEDPDEEDPNKENEGEPQQRTHHHQVTQMNPKDLQIVVKPEEEETKVIASKKSVDDSHSNVETSDGGLTETATTSSNGGDSETRLPNEESEYDGGLGGRQDTEHSIGSENSTGIINDDDHDGAAMSQSPVVILEDAITNDTPFVAKDGCLVWNRPERCVSLCIMFVSELGFQAAWSALLSMQQNPYPPLEFDVFAPKAISPSLESVATASNAGDSAPGTPSAGTGPNEQPPTPKTVKTRPIDPRENTPEAQHDRVLSLLHPAALQTYSYVERHTIACSIIENDHGGAEGSFPLFKDVATCVSLLKLGHTDLLEYLTSEEVYPKYIGGLEFQGILPQKWVCPDGLSTNGQPALGGMINTALRIHHLKNQVLPLHSDEEVTGVVDALSNRLQNEIVCSLVADEGMLSEVVESLKAPRMTSQQLLASVTSGSVPRGSTPGNNSISSGSSTQQSGSPSAQLGEAEVALLIATKRQEEEESICVKLKFLTSLFSLTSQAFAKELVPAVLTKVCGLGVVPALADMCSHYLCSHQQLRGEGKLGSTVVLNQITLGTIRSNGTDTMTSLGSLSESLPRTPDGGGPLGEEIGFSGSGKSEKSDVAKEKKEKRDKKDKKGTLSSSSGKEKDTPTSPAEAGTVVKESKSKGDRKDKKDKTNNSSLQAQSRASSASAASLGGTTSTNNTLTSEQMRAATLTQQAQSSSASGGRHNNTALTVTVFSRSIEKELGRFLEETVNRLNEKGEERTLSEVFRSAIVAEPERYDCFMQFLLRNLAHQGPMSSNRLLLYHLLGMHDDEGSGCDRKNDPEAAEAKNAFHHWFIENILPDAVRWSPTAAASRQQQEAALGASIGSNSGSAVRGVVRSGHRRSIDVGTLPVSPNTAALGIVSSPSTPSTSTSSVGHLSPGMIRLLEYMFLLLTDENRSSLTKVVFGPRSGVVRYLLRDFAPPTPAAATRGTISVTTPSLFSGSSTTTTPLLSGGVIVPTPPTSKPGSPALGQGGCNAVLAGRGASTPAGARKSSTALPAWRKEIITGDVRFLRAALGFKDSSNGSVSASAVAVSSGSGIGGMMGLMMGGHNLIVRSIFVEKDLLLPLLQLTHYHRQRSTMFQSTVLSLLQTILSKDYLLDMRSLMMLRHRKLLPANFCDHCDKEALALLELRMKGGSQEEQELTVRDISRSATPMNHNAAVLMDASFGSSSSSSHTGDKKGRMADDGVNDTSPTPENDQWTGMSSKVRSVIGSLSPSPHGSRSSSVNSLDEDALLAAVAAGGSGGGGLGFLMDAACSSDGTTTISPTKGANISPTKGGGKMPPPSARSPLPLNTTNPPSSSTSPTPANQQAHTTTAASSSSSSSSGGVTKVGHPATKKPQAPSAPREGSGGVRRKSGR